MSATDTRNKHGDLTVHALRTGLYEHRLWHDTKHTLRDVRLSASGDGYRVLEQRGIKVNVPNEGMVDARILLYFPTIKEARAEFKRRSRH